MCAVVQFCTFATSGAVFDRPYDWNQSPLIIPSHFTTQIQMLLEANGLAAGKDHQFKGRYDAEKNAVVISLEKGE